VAQLERSSGVKAAHEEKDRDDDQVHHGDAFVSPVSSQLFKPCSASDT